MNEKIIGVILAAVCLGTSPFMATPTFAKDMSRVPQKQKLDSYVNDLQTNRDANVRARAASYLGVLKDPEALPALHQSLITDVDDQVRMNAANAIARINQKSSAKKLLQAIRPNRSKTDIQIAIIRAMGNMPEHSREYLSVITNFLRSPNPYIREAVVEALWKIRDPRSVRVMNLLVEREKELVVRLSLMKYIADFKSPASLPLLRKVAASSKEHLDVRSLARDAIDKLEAMGLE